MKFSFDSQDVETHRYLLLLGNAIKPASNYFDIFIYLFIKHVRLATSTPTEFKMQLMQQYVDQDVMS